MAKKKTSDAPLEPAVTCIWTALRKRFDAGRYALAFEVKNAPGFGYSRSADAIAVSLWPSDGLLVHGIEIKVSAGDLSAELRNPEKTTETMRYCDRWWLATTPTVRDSAAFERVPDTWGVLVLKAGRLVEDRAPAKLEPKPVDKSFLAAFGKAITRTHDRLLLRDEVDQYTKKQILEAEERARKAATVVNEFAETELKKLTELIAEFEQHSGISLRDKYRWGGVKKVGQAVHLLSSAAADGLLSQQLHQAIFALDSSANNLRAVLGKVQPADASKLEHQRCTN